VKTKNMTAACAIIGLAMSLAGMSYAEGDGGGEEECRCEEPAKGNNGWGNGPDTTNAGSFSGGTAETKSVNGLGADKFDGKFAGR
jgi:hypothetical protein